VLPHTARGAAAPGQRHERAPAWLPWSSLPNPASPSGSAASRMRPGAARPDILHSCVTRKSLEAACAGALRRRACGRGGAGVTGGRGGGAQLQHDVVELGALGGRDRLDGAARHQPAHGLHGRAHPPQSRPPFARWGTARLHPHRRRLAPHLRAQSAAALLARSSERFPRVW